MATSRRVIPRLSIMMAPNTNAIMVNALSVGMVDPARIEYPKAAIRAMTAAHAFILYLTAIMGCRARTARTIKNTSPATRPICNPEMASKCARPASRMASTVTSGIAFLSPVISAVANMPVSPGRLALIRSPTDCLSLDCSNSNDGVVASTCAD